MKIQLFTPVLGTILAGIGLFACPERAQAQTAFSENFDTGSATFTVNDPYLRNPAASNGLILKTDGGNITQDASGSGFFLFEGTGAYNGSPNSPPVKINFTSVQRSASPQTLPIASVSN